MWPVDQGNPTARTLNAVICEAHFAPETPRMPSSRTKRTQPLCTWSWQLAIGSSSFPPKGYIIARHVSDMKFLVARFKQLMSLQVSTHPKDTLLQLTMIQMARSSKLYIQCPELGRIQHCPRTHASTCAMAENASDDHWRDVRTDTRVTSLVFSKDGVGERDVLQLSRTGVGVGLLQLYGLGRSAADAMHAAIHGATLLTPEDSQHDFALIPVLRAGAGRAHAILSRRRMQSFEACGTGVALHMEGFPVVSGWDAVRRLAIVVARRTRSDQLQARRAARSDAAVAAAVAGASAAHAAAIEAALPHRRVVLEAVGQPPPGIRARREYDVELEHKLEVADHWQDARTLYSPRLWPVFEEAGPPPRRSRERTAWRARLTHALAVADQSDPDPRFPLHLQPRVQRAHAEFHKHEAEFQHLRCVECGLAHLLDTCGWSRGRVHGWKCAHCVREGRQRRRMEDAAPALPRQRSESNRFRLLRQVPALAELTPVEEVFIARISVFACLQRHNGARTSYKGCVTYVPKDPSDFGVICNVLPRRADEVASVFVVSTSGYHCRIRRECVRRALHYKVEEQRSTAWRSVRIDHQCIGDMPVDGYFVNGKFMSELLAWPRCVSSPCGSSQRDRRDRDSRT